MSFKIWKTTFEKYENKVLIIHKRFIKLIKHRVYEGYKPWVVRVQNLQNSRVRKQIKINTKETYSFIKSNGLKRFKPQFQTL